MMSGSRIGAAVRQTILLRSTKRRSLSSEVRHYSSFRRVASVAGSATTTASHISSTAPELPPVLPAEITPPPPSNTRQFNRGFLTQLLHRYSVSKQQDRILLAETLFQAATRQAQDPRWFGPGRVPRDFRSRHAVVTLHVWLLHKRLLADAYDREHALTVDEELFHILWDDTTCRIRQTGAMELAVNKHLQKVQQYTFLHLTHYDHCYTPQFLQNPAQRLEELRRLVWHHWFQRDPAVEKRHNHLDRIAWYVDANYRNIMQRWPDEYYRQARVAWVDLPDFTDLRDADGSLMPEQAVFAEDVLPEPWCRHITNRGVAYYWNRATRQSTWDKPTAAAAAAAPPPDSTAHGK